MQKIDITHLEVLTYAVLHSIQNNETKTDTEFKINNSLAALSTQRENVTQWQDHLFTLSNKIS